MGRAGAASEPAEHAPPLPPGALVLLPVTGKEVQLAGGAGPVTAHESLPAERVTDIEQLLGRSIGLLHVGLWLELDRELSLGGGCRACR